MISLPRKYRPLTFEETLSQGSTVKILKKQLELRQFTNCYLFAGPSGCGKTTIARIFGKAINNNKGTLIEIDGASNNGVEAVRDIINSANERAIDSDYKIFIVDECHMITSAGWNAFLKCIEEPPVYTIFMFCTTNPEKIPETIKNRVMRFNLCKVDTALIKDRLMYIAEHENYTNYLEACDYIAKLSQGCVRQAVSDLEKCANFNNNLDINNVLACLGNFSYDSFFNLTVSLLNQDEKTVLSIIEEYYDKGNDLKLFVEQYLDFVLDLTKYCLFKDMNCVKIPVTLSARCEGYANIPGIIDYSTSLVNKILNIKNMIKYDLNYKTTIEALMLNICRA